MGRPKTWDFALGWPEYKERPFIEWLKRECELKKMSFLWVHDGNVDDVIKNVESGSTLIKFLFDMNATYSVPYDRYAHLCYAVKDTRRKVLNDPDDAKSATDKSVTHYDLLEAGIPVPFTVVVRRWEPDTFKLTEAERKNLGIPFVIKPATGYGKIGVVMDAKTLKEVAKARDFAKGDNFLLQERIEPVTLNGKRAWFRVFYVFGEAIPCWWDICTGGTYQHVTFSEMYNFKLLHLVRIVTRIARITNMEFFTTEIAVSRRGDQKVPIAIDYVNDQCDLDVKSEQPSAPPNDVVEHIIRSIVRYAKELQQGQQLPRGIGVWLAR